MHLAGLSHSHGSKTGRYYIVNEGRGEKVGGARERRGREGGKEEVGKEGKKRMLRKKGSKEVEKGGEGEEDGIKRWRRRNTRKGKENMWK